MKASRLTCWWGITGWMFYISWGSQGCRSSSSSTWVARAT